ncbi:helix-turn-helix domain-containing protein [Methylosinus sp. Sm6]|uniref:helix-turn-helix domain-containing protein n=1 Tax=Methylosinus sp. Sm6 TaxID=2866948 RepID=UPI001C9A26A3|nr:helix-turn-helix domain-containing protein [Methylosinus sp. Sm6]MBY6240052.1 helix-turn-helix domain-containing protein [Methylosinus sp. Sm6]
MRSDDEPHSGIIPDQGKKLTYLITVRGDQRPVARDKQHALGDIVNRDGLSYPSPVVTNQARLAEALGLDATAVTRWVKEQLRIPVPHIKEICRIFQIDEQVFRERDFDALRQYCAGSSLRSPTDWRDTFLGKIDVRGSIMLTDPFSGQIGRTRYAGIGEDDTDELPATEVPAGAPFWMDFVSPRGRDGKPLWADWPMLLFNHDVRIHGFKCFLPAYREHEAFRQEVFPAKGALVLPRRPVLKHPVEDAGEFEMILIVAQDRFPDDVTGRLSDKRAHGAAIEDALRILSEWIGDRMKRGTADMGKARYRVVLPTAR